ncbi:MAG: hypothetical protein ACRDLL_04425 [Solirubrobacterales bacterium]
MSGAPLFSPDERDEAGMFVDLAGRPITREMRRNILAVEELNRRGYGHLDDPAFARHVAELLRVSHAEAMQRIAWFDDWMRDPVYLPNAPGGGG